MDLQNKSILLTGAASGIGQALLDLLAGYPGQILAVDVNAAGLESACERMAGKPAKIIPFVCDLSSQASVDGLFDGALKMIGGIDLFIANAGFAYYEVVEHPDWAHLEQIYRLNVFSTLYIVEKMAALFKEKPYKVVVTASAMAHIAVPGYSIYSSTKAALDRFADGYRWQMKDARQLMLVYPISTRTGFFKAAGRDVPTPWPSQSPQAVAKAILRGVQHDRTRVYPSTTFQLVLFMDRFLPMHQLVQQIEQRRMQKWLAVKK